jgi:hypothetical protein
VPTAILPNIAPAVLLLALKLLVVTYGSKQFRALAPDGLGAWLSAWIALQAYLFVVMLLASAVHGLNALTIWSAVALAVVIVLWSARGSPPLFHASETARTSGIAPWLFAALFIAVTLRASIFSDFTRDGQTYTLVRNAVWMNNHSLLVHMPSPQIAVFVYEWNSDLIAVGYGLVSGNLQGLTFGNIEIFLFCYLAFCWLALRLGANLAWATMVALGCGLIKPKPQSDNGNFDHGEVVESVAVVTGCNVPELLELVEAAFDQVAFLILGFAVGNAVVAVRPWRDVRRALLVFDQIPDPVGVVALVGDDIGARR